MPQIAPPAPPYVGPPRWHGGAGNKPIVRIVVHCTAGSEPGSKGAARGTANYSKNTSRPSSWHYCADALESVQLTFDSYIAYHCGKNSNSLGYELCCSLSNSGGILVKATAGAKALTHWQTPSHRAMLRIAAKEIAQLCLAYDVPIRKLTVAQVRAGEKGLCGHVDIRDAFPGVTTHWDPGPFFPWRRFIRMIRREARALLEAALPVPKPEPTPEQPAELEVEYETHDPFGTAILPGKWNAKLKAWVRRFREVVDKGVQIVTFTEATRHSLARDLQVELAEGGWGSYWDSGFGPSNIMHTWDLDRFEHVGTPWKVKLEDIGIQSKTGFHRPDTYAVGVALRDKVTGKVILRLGTHLPLTNTPRRAQAQEMAKARLKEYGFDAGREQFPEAVRQLAADFNSNAKLKAVREWFTSTWPGLTPAWVLDTERRAIDWEASGGRLVLLESDELPRAKRDPLDHTTKTSRWAWRRKVTAEPARASS